MDQLKQEVEKNSVKVFDNLFQDLQAIFDKADKRKLSPFMKLFWKEQLNCVSMSSNQVCCHPMTTQ